MSLFRLYGLYVCTDLTISKLYKSREFVLKIDPIGGLKFGSAGKPPYLCSVKR